MDDSGDEIDGKKSAIKTLLGEMKGWDKDRLRAKKGVPEKQKDPDASEDKDLIAELLRKLKK